MAVTAMSSPQQEGPCPAVRQSFEVAFPGRPKAERDSGAKDAEGKLVVTCCAPALKCARPADVTTGEFKSPKLGGSPAQFYGQSTRRCGPPGVSGGTTRLGRSPAGMR